MTPEEHHKHAHFILQSLSIKNEAYILHKMVQALKELFIGKNYILPLPPDVFEFERHVLPSDINLLIFRNKYNNDVRTFVFKTMEYEFCALFFDFAYMFYYYGDYYDGEERPHHLTHYFDNTILKMYRYTEQQFPKGEPIFKSINSPKLSL